MKFYTEEEIQIEENLFDDYHCDRAPNLSVYVSRETDTEGNVIGFTLGMEDEEGNAVTGGFEEKH